MSFETVVAILSPLIVGFGVAWTLFITFFLNKKWEKHKEIRETHCDRLAHNLRVLRDSRIYYIQFNFRINPIDEIDNKILDWTIQHLKSYEEASQNWNELNQKISEINNDLQLVERSIADKINRILQDEIRKWLKNGINIITESFIAKQLDNLDHVKKTNDDGSGYVIHISSDTTFRIPYNNDKQEIMEIYNEILTDNSFRTKLINLQEKKKYADKLFQDLKSNLNDILRFLENGYEFKGKCDGCPVFWRLRE